MCIIIMRINNVFNLMVFVICALQVILVSLRSLMTTELEKLLSISQAG